MFCRRVGVPCPPCIIYLYLPLWGHSADLLQVFSHHPSTKKEQGHMSKQLAPCCSHPNSEQMLWGAHQGADLQNAATHPGPSHPGPSQKRTTDWQTKPLPQHSTQPSPTSTRGTPMGGCCSWIIVNHSPLLMDLGIDSSLCNWILDFLSARKQVVKIGSRIPVPWPSAQEPPRAVS